MEQSKIFFLKHFIDPNFKLKESQINNNYKDKLEEYNIIYLISKIKK